MDLKEIDFDSIEYNGKQIVSAYYLSGKQVTGYELEILEATLWNQEI
jgi:hypothetical protein